MKKKDFFTDFCSKNHPKTRAGPPRPPQNDFFLASRGPKLMLQALKNTFGQ